MKENQSSPPTIAISNELPSTPPKKLPVGQVNTQVIPHVAESKAAIFSENYSRFTEDDRSWDITFWQNQGPAAIFEAMWGMIKDHRLLTQNDATEPRLQRTVEYFGKA